MYNTHYLCRTGHCERCKLNRENDTYVINSDLEEHSIEEEAETSSINIENTSESNSKTNQESAPETELETVISTEIESESTFETKSEENSEPETNTESELETNTEFESDTTYESETEIESESILESESESKLETEQDVQAAVDAFHEIAAEKPLMALLYRTEAYDVRQEPSKNSESIVTIKSGHTLYIKSVKIVDDNVWYQVQLGLNSIEYTGYVEAYYLAYSDENWISWEKDYLSKLVKKMTQVS